MTIPFITLTNLKKASGGLEISIMPSKDSEEKTRLPHFVTDREGSSLSIELVKKRLEFPLAKRLRFDLTSGLTFIFYETRIPASQPVERATIEYDEKRDPDINSDLERRAAA